MAVAEQSLLLAVRNVAHRGDTDVFPFPLENHWLHDSEVDVTQLLMELDRGFDDWLRAYPVTSATCLSSVGYNGFRAATQIDPIWNAYLLALVIELAPDLELARLPSDRGLVFSYRFKPSSERNTLFDPDRGWSSFHQTAIERAASSEFVVSTDISDFYARVYHHRLENLLDKRHVIRRPSEGSWRS